MKIKEHGSGREGDVARKTTGDRRSSEHGPVVNIMETWRKREEREEKS